jgi:hypothetical protein
MRKNCVNPVQNTGLACGFVGRLYAASNQIVTEHAYKNMLKPGLIHAEYYLISTVKKAYLTNIFLSFSPLSTRLIITTTI